MESQPLKVTRACKAVALILACSAHAKDNKYHMVADLFVDAARYFTSGDPFFEVDVDDAKRGFSGLKLHKYLAMLGLVEVWGHRCYHKKSICPPDVNEGKQIKILKNLGVDTDKRKPLDPSNTRALKEVAKTFTSLLEAECNRIFAENTKKMENSVRKAAESASATKASSKSSRKRSFEELTSPGPSRSSTRLANTSTVTPQEEMHDESSAMEEEEEQEEVDIRHSSLEEAIIEEFATYGYDMMAQTKKQRTKDGQNETRIKLIQKAFPKNVCAEAQVHQVEHVPAQ